jgi:hypothetical protein
VGTVEFYVAFTRADCRVRCDKVPIKLAVCLALVPRTEKTLMPQSQTRSPTSRKGLVRQGTIRRTLCSCKRHLNLKKNRRYLTGRIISLKCGNLHVDPPTNGYGVTVFHHSTIYSSLFHQLTATYSITNKKNKIKRTELKK